MPIRAAQPILMGAMQTTPIPSGVSRSIGNRNSCSEMPSR